MPRDKTAILSKQRVKAPMDTSVWEEAVARMTLDAHVLRQVRDLGSDRVGQLLVSTAREGERPQKAPRGSTKADGKRWDKAVDQGRAELTHARMQRDFGSRVGDLLVSPPSAGAFPKKAPKLTTRSEAAAWAPTPQSMPDPRATRIGACFQSPSVADALMGQAREELDARSFSDGASLTSTFLDENPRLALVVMPC